MKLTEKAVNDFIENGTGFTHPSKWDFEPTDFEDCVVLTVREAETIEHIIAIFQHYYNIFDGEMKVWQDLRKRIEEAEKKNG